MRRRMTWLVMPLLLLPQAAQASGIDLKYNPFERPAIKESGQTAHDAAQKTGGPVMSLRATMVAGVYSLADIGGEILGIGEQINGYRLVGVYPRHVVLEKNDTQKTLSIDNETENTQ